MTPNDSHDSGLSVNTIVALFCARCVRPLCKKCIPSHLGAISPPPMASDVPGRMSAFGGKADILDARSNVRF